jgi:hypothetical protein
MHEELQPLALNASNETNGFNELCFNKAMFSSTSIPSDFKVSRLFSLKTRNDIKVKKGLTTQLKLRLSNDWKNDEKSNF